MQPPPKDVLRSRLLWSMMLLFVFYAVGAVAFVQAEREYELFSIELNRYLYKDMRNMYSFQHCADPSFSSLSFCKDQAQFSAELETFFNHHGNSVEDRQQWTILGSIFFLTQLTATIGYGNTAAATVAGKALTMVFAVIGIPIMGYVIFTMAMIDLAVVNSVCNSFGIALDTQGRQAGALAGMAMCFLLLGSGFYHFMEGWTYLEALYFSFTTLTTVGFGDYLPSTPASKLFSIFYIIFGLGNCASIIALIAIRVEKSHMGIETFVRERLLSYESNASDKEAQTVPPLAGR